MYKNRWILLLLLFHAGTVSAQLDTADLQRIYDRCLDFSEDKADSVAYYAKLIDSLSRTLHFSKGHVFSLRLEGLAADLGSRFEKAAGYYLQSLEEARRLGIPRYEISALSDLAILYFNIKQPNRALDFYLQCLPLVRRSGDISMKLTTYNNLAVIYTQLGQYDSALALLNESLSYEKMYGSDIDFTATYNNLGHLYYNKAEYRTALPYFSHNLRAHIRDSSNADLWLDHVNLADVYGALHEYDSARYHAGEALKRALSMKSRSREADTYAMYARLYEKTRDYGAAYRFLSKWYEIDTSLVNAETNRSIASLQERFNAREREAENKLLLARVERERLQNQNVTVIAFALGAIALLSVMAFVTIRRANRKLEETNSLTRRQNEKLEELNFEKNALLGIVSHDLSAPFASIQAWSEVLASGENELSEEQQKALERIREAGAYGERIIDRILDVERTEEARHRIELKSFSLPALVRDLAEDFLPQAADKNIRLLPEISDESLEILSDPHLLRRLLQNLLSNAIKFTPPGKKVFLRVSGTNDQVLVQVEDQGVGIPPSELPNIFYKYSQISSRPTGGENSHGMGLSIVKRIADELQAKIECRSEAGQGTIFTVYLNK